MIFKNQFSPNVLELCINRSNDKSLVLTFNAAEKFFIVDTSDIVFSEGKKYKKVDDLDMRSAISRIFEYERYMV